MFNDFSFSDIGFSDFSISYDDSSDESGSFWGGVGSFVQDGFATWTDYVQSDNAMDVLRMQLASDIAGTQNTENSIPTTGLTNGSTVGSWITGIPNYYVIGGAALLVVGAIVAGRK